MNAIEQSIMQAIAASHQRIDAASAAAKEAVREHAARELDRIKVKVGWMIRSSGAKQGWRKRKEKREVQK